MTNIRLNVIINLCEVIKLNFDNLNTNDLKFVINSNKISANDKKLLYRLYSLIYNSNQKRINNLASLEEEIYNFEGKTLSDEYRIKLAIKSLESKAREKNYPAILDIIEMLENLAKKDLTPEVVRFMKKRIVELQVFLGESITFFSVLEDLFQEKMLRAKLSQEKIEEVDKDKKDR